MRSITNLVIVTLAAIVGLLFHIRNDALVTVDYYLGSIEWPLSWALGAALLLGVALGCAACLGSVVRLKRLVRALNKRNAAANREIATLKADRTVTRQTGDVS
jgi:uncharacterized integral membrane protein